jgi:hypothetical protein
MDLSGYVLTADNISTLRRLLIRDHFDTAQSPPLVMSRYNSTYKKNFINDTDIRELSDEIVIDQEEELESAYQEKYDERQVQGDDVTLSTSKADDAQIYMLLKLINAEVKRMMVNDSAFVASVLSGPGGEAMLKRMVEEAEESVLYVSSRTGDYVSVRVERE